MYTIIEKEVDIYRYPNEFEKSLGSITLGDLHGNAVKLIYFLIRHQIISFKEGINAEQSYAHFVRLYEQLAELRDKITANQLIISSESNSFAYHVAKIERFYQLHEKEQKSAEEQIEFDQFNIEQHLIAKNNCARQLNYTLAESSDLKSQLPLQIAHFHQFMTQLEVQDKNTLVRLVGDELADRGSNDYLTLRILAFLRNEGVEVTTIVSNHGMEFVTAYEALALQHCFKAKKVLSDDYKMSFVGLTLLLDEGVITESELSTLVNYAYKPTLKVIDYALNDTADEISLFTHAPVSFAAIKHISSCLECVYDDSSAKSLASTIDAINMKLANLVSTNRVHDLYNARDMDFANMSLEQINEYPLLYFIWNRWDLEKDTENARPSCHNGYRVNYIHGHDSYESQYGHVYNLDTVCGKHARERNQHMQVLLVDFDNQMATEARGIYETVTETYKVWNSDEYQPKQLLDCLKLSIKNTRATLGLFARLPYRSDVSADINSEQPTQGHWHNKPIITQHIALNSQPQAEVHLNGGTLSIALKLLDEDYCSFKR